MKAEAWHIMNKVFELEDRVTMFNHVNLMRECVRYCAKHKANPNSIEVIDDSLDIFLTDHSYKFQGYILHMHNPLKMEINCDFEHLYGSDHRTPISLRFHSIDFLAKYVGTNDSASVQESAVRDLITRKIKKSVEVPKDDILA